MEVDSEVEEKDSFPFLSLNSGLLLRPVAFGGSGEGLPYAPEDFPNHGDKWGWKTGRRINGSGFWTDRYLSIPKHHQKTLGKHQFPSRTTVAEFLKKKFPNVDICNFFASFSWRIPAPGPFWVKDGKHYKKLPESLEVSEEFKPSLPPAMGTCKAGNIACNPHVHERSYSLPLMDCDICCTEPGFCRNCSCILCCKSINWEHEGFSFIRCESMQNDYCICGHVAHLSCALNCHMAGTIGGNVGLNVEYYCRRCDQKSDLILHVTKLRRTCKSLASKNDVEKNLNLALSILRGSRRMSAKSLSIRIEASLEKLKSGICPKEIWKEEESQQTLQGYEYEIAEEVPCARG